MGNLPARAISWLSGKQPFGSDVEHPGHIEVNGMHQRPDHIFFVDHLHHGIKAHQDRRPHLAQEAGHAGYRRSGPTMLEKRRTAGR